MTEPPLESSVDQSVVNSTTTDARSTTSDSTAVPPYYELRLPRGLLQNKSPSKIEFQLVNSRPKRAAVPPRRNLFTQATQCNGGCRSKEPPPNPTKVRRSVKRVFFNFNRKSKQEVPPELPEQQFENMEVYYFDHGCPEFYRTTDCPPHLVTEALAQSTHHHATKFWAEMFGTVNIGTTFVISFWLQLYRFLLYGIARSIIVGVLQITADYLLKPVLAVVFNGLVQPPVMFVQNVLTALGGMVEPIGRAIGCLLLPVGRILQSVRLVEYKTVNKKIVRKRRFDV